MIDHLELIAGKSQQISIPLLDENGNPENLAGITSATITIKDSIGGSVIFTATTGSGFDLTDGIVTFTVALGSGVTVGTFIADINVTVSGDTFASDLFYVDIRQGVT